MTRSRGPGLTAWLALALLPSACNAQANVDGDGVPYDGPEAPFREPQACSVTRVIDGDTLQCAPLGRVRLIGIDAPERAQEPFGAMATAALREMVPEGSEVLLEPDVEDRDRYDRALRYVWVEGRLVNWALVRGGYAVLLTYPPNVQYVHALQEAQQAARDAETGLWSFAGFACPPADYRRGACR